MATTQLTRSMTSTGNRKTATFSSWIKKCDPTKDTMTQISFGGTHNIYLHTAGFRWNDGTGNYIYSTAVLRDTSGWYHLVVAIDTTQSTDTDRVKLYVNGVQLALTSETWPDEDEDLLMNVSGTDIFIGNDDSGTGYFDGVMSHVYWIDGLAYAPTVFGETDATTGEWKIKTSPTVTYGTNGFLIMKDGDTITDQGDNSNDFTVDAGTLTKTEDCPSDVFCTANPLFQRATNKTMGFLYGNTEVWVGTGATDKACGGTLAVSKGKFYWEQKVIANDGAGTNVAVVGGLFATDDYNEAPTNVNTADSCGMMQAGNVYKDTTDLGNFTTAPVGGDIFGIAFDADLGTVKFWRAGVALNSGNAIITGLDTSKTWTPFFVCHSGTGNARTISNFGNGYFQTTAITSAGTNASNIGLFEYDVPTGYTALSTKGMNS